MLSLLYRLLTDLGAPFIALYLRRRLKAGKEDAERFGERLGKASVPRPAGRLVWCHAASVGEAISLLTLIEAMRERQADARFLITTGTVTSAKTVAARAGASVIHQYVPVDRHKYVRRFLDHWRPDVAVWVESDLWPNLLAEVRRQMIPAVLVNGRMSEKSFRNWLRARGWARRILSAFSLCLTQTEDERGRFAALGAKPVRCLGNLKYAAKPLPVDERELERLTAKIGQRPVWVMASTHRGEEAMAIAVHKALRDAMPDLLTVIVPRHPRRGDEVAMLAEAAHLHLIRRSAGDAPVPSTDIYLVDTLGELGLFYRLCPVAAIGGSFLAFGGHNPIEPAQLDTAVVFGPSMFNFAEIAKEFVNHDAAIQLRHANELAFTIRRLLAEPASARRYAHNARSLAIAKANVLVDIVNALTPWLGVNASGPRRRRA